MSRRTTSDDERKLFEQTFKEGRPIKVAAPKSPAKKKAISGAPSGINGATQDKLRRGLIEPDARIALHGMTQEAAHRTLFAWMATAQIADAATTTTTLVTTTAFVPVAISFAGTATDGTRLELTAHVTEVTLSRLDESDPGTSAGGPGSEFLNLSMTTDDGARYRFGPRERSGALAGLRAGQILTVAMGLLGRAQIGLPLDEPIIAARRYYDLDADQVRAAFAKLLRPDAFVQVVRGPPPQ